VTERELDCGLRFRRDVPVRSMIGIRRSQPAVLGFFVVVAFSSCGLESDGQELPVPPTAAELSRLVAETREPAYWWGPQIEGIEVSHASASEDEVALTYGRWTCDSGCSDSGGVTTGRRGIGRLSRFEYANTRIDTEDCWTRVGKAVAVLPGAIRMATHRSCSYIPAAARSASPACTRATFRVRFRRGRSPEVCDPSTTGLRGRSCDPSA
jgi:hypothetical protein